MIEVSEVLNDPDFQQTWIVWRSSGSWIAGVWTENTKESIEMSGVVTPSTAKDLQMLPEGDRITESKTFHSTDKIYTTRNGVDAGTSDQIEYKGELFKVMSAKDYMDYGYNKAVAVRIAGD